MTDDLAQINYGLFVQSQQNFGTDPRGHIVSISSMPPKSPAGARLKALRNRANLTVRETADLIERRFTSFSYYENEYKKDALPAELVNALADVLEGRGTPPITRAEILSLGGIEAVVTVGDNLPMDKEIFMESVRDTYAANKRAGGDLDEDDIAELAWMFYESSLNKPKDHRRAVREGIFIAHRQNKLKQ